MPTDFWEDMRQMKMEASRRRRVTRVPYMTEWPFHAALGVRLRNGEITQTEYDQLFTEASERMKKTKEGILPLKPPLVGPAIGGVQPSLSSVGAPNNIDVARKASDRIARKMKGAGVQFWGVLLVLLAVGLP
jgi:hypothetical protein